MFVVVFSVTTTFALAALALPENFEHYLNLVKALEIPALIIFSGKTVLAWPLCYHAFNGIRHLVGICRLLLYQMLLFVFALVKKCIQRLPDNDGLDAFFLFSCRKWNNNSLVDLIYCSYCF